MALGVARVTAATSGWTEQTVEALAEGERLAKKALDLDASNAQAHALLGDVYLNRAREPAQYDRAREEDEKAIELNPNDAVSHAALGGVLVFAGYPEEAVRQFEIAARLDPGMNLVRLYPSGWAYYLVGRYEDAVRVGESAARENPADYFPHACLAASYAQLGRTDDAARAASSTWHAWPFFRVDTFVSQFKREVDRTLIADGLRKAGLK